MKKYYNILIVLLLLALQTFSTNAYSSTSTNQKDNLLSSVVNNSVNSVKRAIRRGANVNELTLTFTPLMIAAIRDENGLVISELIKGGADINATVKINPKVFFGPDKEDIKRILTLSGYLKIAALYPDTELLTPLMLATILNESTAAILQLIKAGANVNAASDGGTTPLILAVKASKNDLFIAELIKSGANVNVRESNTLTPLMIAVDKEKGNNLVVRELIKGGADVNAKSKGGVTALMIAAQWAQNELVALELIKAGADVNAKDDGGVTPLMIAAGLHEATSFIDELVKAGADVNATDKEGKNCIDYANESSVGTDRHKIVNFILATEKFKKK